MSRTTYNDDRSNYDDYNIVPQKRKGPPMFEKSSASRSGSRSVSTEGPPRKKRRTRLADRSGTNSHTPSRHADQKQPAAEEEKEGENEDEEKDRSEDDYDEKRGRSRSKRTNPKKKTPSPQRILIEEEGEEKENEMVVISDVQNTFSIRCTSISTQRCDMEEEDKENENDETTINIELNVLDILQVVTSSPFMDTVNRMLLNATPGGLFHKKMTIGGSKEDDVINAASEGNDKDKETLERNHNDFLKRMDLLGRTASSIIDTVKNPFLGTICFETVKAYLPPEVWGIIGRYIAVNSQSFGTFMYTVSVFGKLVRSCILKSMLSDPEWLRCWSDESLYPNSRCIFVFAISIWRPIDATNCSISKQKKRPVVSSKQRNAAAVMESTDNGNNNNNNNNEASESTRFTPRDKLAPMDMKHVYAFHSPWSFGSGSFIKADTQGSTYSRITDAIAAATNNRNETMVKSINASDSEFETFLSLAGKELLESSGTKNSASQMKAMGITAEEQELCGSMAQEKVGRRLFFNKHVHEQMEAYRNYSIATGGSCSEETNITHAVSYICPLSMLMASNKNNNNNNANAERDYFIIKIKRPNSAAEKKKYDPLSGSGVQIKKVTTSHRLFPFIDIPYQMPNKSNENKNAQQRICNR